MSIRKRALSLLLVLVMLLGVLPAGAAAAAVYQDVPSGHWASDYIARVAEQGLMVGTSDTTFAPEETITRAMFVTILARYAKAETDNNAETAFADVPAGQYYTGAVAWAAANGIVNGTSAVTFAPNDPVTREQMAALLYRAMRFLGNKCPQDGKLDAFSDASALSDWAVEGMIWAAGAGLFGGFEDGTLRPQETATRAQAAKVFCVLLDYSEQPEPTEPSAEPTEPSEEPTQEPTAEPTDPTEPTEPETGFTVTFKGEGGYAKVNGEKVTSVTLEPGVTWLNFNLYGDHSEGFDLDQVAASSGTLQRVRSEFILRDITEDVTVTFTTTGMIVTVTFVSKQVATVTPEKVQVPWGQTEQQPAEDQPHKGKIDHFLQNIVSLPAWDIACRDFAKSSACQKPFRTVSPPKLSAGQVFDSLNHIIKGKCLQGRIRAARRNRQKALAFWGKTRYNGAITLHGRETLEAEKDDR